MALPRPVSQESLLPGIGLLTDELDRSGLFAKNAAAGQIPIWSSTLRKWVATDAPIGFPSGVTTKIFDSTLGADTAAIDSGAGSIVSTFDVLEIWILARTDDAVAAAAMDVILNNDTGANYDRQFIDVTTATVAGGNALAAAAWTLNCHGSGGAASYVTTARITIPSYAQTSFFKVGEAFVSRLDSTAGNAASDYYTLCYKSTPAITRVKVAAQGAAKLKAGSRLLIYGR